MVSNRSVFFSVLLIICILLPSCDYIFGVENLGHGYHFDTDYIVYDGNESYSGHGLCVVPPLVLKVYNSRKSIVIGSLNKKNEEVYWVINKTIEKHKIGYHENDSILGYYNIYSNIQGPLGYYQLKEILKNENINLNALKWEHKN